MCMDALVGQVWCSGSYLMQSEHSISPLSTRSAGTILVPQTAAVGKLLASSVTKHECKYFSALLNTLQLQLWSHKSGYCNIILGRESLLPGLCTLEGGLKVAEGSSPLCFLLTPPGGAGSAARTPARVFVLFSSAAGSDLLGHREDCLEDDSSTGVLDTLNSESWKHRQKRREEMTRWI